MGLRWLLVIAACAVAYACADHGGSSLRGALEALQRRQRGRMHGPILPQPDYDALYEFVPPQAYPDLDYSVVEDIDDEPAQKYYVKLLDDDSKPPETYEYKLIKKKNSANSAPKKESPFRERSHHSDNERLRELFMDKNDNEEEKKTLGEGPNNDAEYALLLGQLWSKYKYDKEHANGIDTAPQGIVKLYKEKIVKKRYPDNWGPIAFKRKRSPAPEGERQVLFDYGTPKSGDPSDPSYDDDKDDFREDYALAFEPLDEETLADLVEQGHDPFEIIDKHFPVAKRSSGSYDTITQKKRNAQSQNKREASKAFRSSAGTDPKIIKDLSKIFGDTEVSFIKSPVKRSSDHEEHEHDHDHEVKPPMITTHNDTHGHNNSVVKDDDSHEHHGHNIHHPGISGKEIEHEHPHSHDHAHDHNHNDNNKPIHVRKKSINWSEYFGIDKRSSKQPLFFASDFTQNKLKKQYFDTFNKEVMNPQNSVRHSTTVKRNYVETKPNEETEIQIDRAHLAVQKDDKRNSATNEDDSKLDSIDKKLRNLEGMIVDEALHDSNVGDDLDSKEEQEMKEKLLSRLAAAYSLEKMRKALKEFKQSLQMQKAKPSTVPSPTPTDEAKSKRIAIKKEKVVLSNEIPAMEKVVEPSNDFEEEQGAGHYVNGKIDEHFSEGYMGGSGRHRIPVMSTEGTAGSCPVLAKIVQRCRSVDILAGDRGQLFLPLCSLHQICYLCGESPPTTCDLMFLSEADSTCEGDMICQRAARSALMALRELHDNLADELDGECEANPCLIATLKLNVGWQRAFQQ